MRPPSSAPEAAAEAPAGSAAVEAAPQTAFPALTDLFESIGESLRLNGQLGLLSITVLQRGAGRPWPGWETYESVIREVSEFVSGSGRDRIRHADRLLGPSRSGNACVLLMDPPRDGRLMGQVDLRRVQRRLKEAIGVHLAQRLSAEAVDQFGCYVGCAMLRHDPDVDVERMVYRSLEEAFADALRERSSESRRRSIHVRRVLRRGLVQCVYQPIVQVAERRVVGYEALTRIPLGPLTTVELLFKTARENDALWTLERLCRRRAVEGRPSLDPDQLIFMNIEPDSIPDPDLRSDAFARELLAAGVASNQIVLEITEHSAVRHTRSYLEMLARFRELGFRLAMDDVGAGYSGLQAIAEIAPDFLKTDRALVRDIDTNRLKRELIATMRRFTENTGITLVAEGVETPDELRTLLDLGVRCAQGYLFARPNRPPAEPDWSAIP